VGLAMFYKRVKITQNKMQVVEFGVETSYSTGLRDDSSSAQ